MRAGEALVVPAVGIRLAGDDVACDQLASVRVRREAGAPAACELRFEDPTGAGLDEMVDHLVPGHEVELRVGDEVGVLFRGDLLTVEHHYAPGGLRQVLLRAQDRSHRWRQDCRVRAFVDVTVGDLIEEVAGEAGLTAQIEDPGPQWPRFLQDGRSTLELITDLTERAGLTWHVDAEGTRVRVAAAGSGRGEPVALDYGDELLEATVRLTAMAAHDSWRATGWDPVTGDLIDEQVGVDLPADAVGNVTLAAGVRSGALFADEGHAEHAARALAVRSLDNARSLRALVHGDPRLEPGVRVRVGGLADATSGEYVLTSADHLVDAVGGYLCVISSAHPPATTVTSREFAHTTLADVVRVDDPDARGRVKVVLLGLDGLESEWLPVLALGAGSDKGLTCQPDVGDRVVVAHQPQDPGRGVVLGTLRTEAGSEPGTGVSGGTVGTYAMRLPGGQQLRLTADQDEVSLTNGTGSLITMDASGTRLHSVGDLVIEAPGRRITLRANAIDMERG